MQGLHAHQGQGRQGMTKFDFISVLVSIVFGLGPTHLGE
jgi:hypothetical protein